MDESRKCQCWLVEKGEQYTLHDVVSCYSDVILPCKKAELSYYSNLMYKWTFEKVVEIALESRGKCGKLHPHQWRIGIGRITECLPEHAGINLQPELENLNSFEEIHEKLWEHLGSELGIGRLYFYDAALHIGAARGVYPKDIYLHSGAEWGAEKLHMVTCKRGDASILGDYFNCRNNKYNLKLQKGCKYIKIPYAEYVKEYPAFGGMDAYLIENCLCHCNGTFIDEKLIIK